MTQRNVKPDQPVDKNKWMILGAVMLGVIMGPIDGSIVNVVLPTIATSFQTDYALVQWVPTIYLLAICSFILIYGRLGDMFGYKRIFLTGLACFAGASLLCGLSRNIWMLIFFRALQGLTVAMQMALGLAIVTSAFHPIFSASCFTLTGVSAWAGIPAGGWPCCWAPSYWVGFLFMWNEGRRSPC